MESVLKDRRLPEGGIQPEGGFCCFCAVCGRRPPDPDSKIWIETEGGCICQRCFNDAIGRLLEGKEQSSAKQGKTGGPVDVQFGCCQLNKKLLNKTLDSLKEGGHLEIIAENTETMHAIVKKYVEAKGCTITGIKDENGTCLIKIMRPD
jgi:TusA-related sulfurtransferase